MKILCVIDSLGSGGAQRQMVELAKGFKERGHEVSFLTYHETNFFKSKLEKHDIQVKTIVESNYVKRLFKMRNVIRKHRPDAVLSFLEAANFIATFAGLPKRKWKLVVGERNANPNILNNKKLRLYRYAHYFTDYVVGNSQKNIDLVKQIIPNFSDRKLKVIYNAIEIPETNKYITTHKEKTHIAIAARYKPQKNLEGLIEAIGLLPKHYKAKLKIEWYGNISTNNTYYQEQLNRINKLGIDGILKLNDKTNQITQKYKDADYIGLFSHYEGFPNTICEAMVLKKPVIVTPVSDVPFFIKENKNGFLCKSDDVYSIRDAIIKAIESTGVERLKMGNNNFNAAREKFDKKKIVKRYLVLLGDKL